MTSYTNTISTLLAERGGGVPFMEGLADALDWKKGFAEIVPSYSPDNHLYRGYVAGEPAILFGATESRDANSLVNLAAVHAYHATIEWGIIASANDLVIFNSHWTRDSGWYRLPAIELRRLNEHQDLISAFTPHQLMRGESDKIAKRYVKPDGALLPVDEGLVQRLADWRRETFRRATEVPADLDEKLQTLFAQLFVLRAIEDRGIAPGLPPLRSTLAADGFDSTQMQSILDYARDHIQSELFVHNSYISIPNNVLKGIIEDLYTPKDLPIRGFHYDFSLIDADVLGQAYEQYLSSLLIPSSKPDPQQDLFGEERRSVEEVSVRRASGTYYTPQFLVRYLTEKSLDVVDLGSNGEPQIPRVADFSCGSGSFLAAAASVVLRKLREISPKENWGQRLIKERKIIGIDNDQRAVTLARLTLWLRLAEEPDPLPLPQLEDIIVHGDSLGTEVWGQLPKEYDVILGNPPFIATGSLRSAGTQLAERFETARGRYDYANLFAELAIKKLRGGGVMGMVLPNRLFVNKAAGSIRKLLMGQAELVVAIDFNTNKLFGETKAYIGAIVAQKRGQGAKGREVLRFIDVVELHERFQAAELRHAEYDDKPSDAIVAFDVKQPHGQKPWRFLSPADREGIARLRREAYDLSELAETPQGIKTGLNEVFILEPDEISDTLVWVTDGFGDSVALERALLHPMAYGSSVRRYQEVQPEKMLLYPYREGSVIEEVELRERYPQTWSYLNSYRDMLASRGSLNNSQKWYELVRKRDEQWLEAPKLIIRDLVVQNAFAPDLNGGVYLVGGTAIVPANPDHLLPLLAFLNSSITEGYLNQTALAYRDGFKKIEPRHLSNLPVPHFIVGSSQAADELSYLAECAVNAVRSNNPKELTRIEDQIDDLIHSNI